MSRRLAVAAVVVALAFACGRLSAGDTKEGSKEDKVRKLLKLLGSYDAAKVQYDAMLQQFEMNPSLPKGFGKAFKKIAKANDMVEITVPVWAKHLDDECLDAYLAFFETASGKKTSEAMPKILEGAQQAGMRWGMEVSMKAALEAQKGGAGDEDEDDDEKKPAKKPEKKEGDKKEEKKDGEKKPY